MYSGRPASVCPVQTRRDESCLFHVLPVGPMLKKPDLNALQGKSLNEVANHAEDLAKGGLEDRLNAHAIFASILEQLPATTDRGVAQARMTVTSRLWTLEKSFFWHERYFSQAGQDKRIKDAFFRNRKDGFFLEIGAYDGVTGSNCLHFEKFMGWDGVAVEPSRTQYKFLEKNRRCKTVEKAVGFPGDTVEFVEVVAGPAMLSGVNSEDFAMTRAFLDNDKASRTITHDVETVRIMELAGDRSVVDFMSLDIEGAELKVLESIDFNRVRIRVIAVENTNVGSSTFRTFFDGIGYRYFDTIGHDEIYFHPDSVSFTRD